MVVGGWGMVSKGRGYDFAVSDRLENSTTTPSSIFCFWVQKNFDFFKQIFQKIFSRPERHFY